MSELEKLINDWGSYLDKMRSSYLGDLAKKSLSKESVCAYIRHIPIEDIHDGWPNEVYKKTEIMIIELYEYSKEMGYIPENMSLEGFIRL